MGIVIIALIVFGIGLGGLITDTIKKTTTFKIVASVVLLVVYILSIGWALNKF